MLFIVLFIYYMLINCSEYDLIVRNDNTLNEFFMNIATEDLLNTSDITASDLLSFYQTIEPIDNDGSGLDISRVSDNNITTALDELNEFLIFDSTICSITDENSISSLVINKLDEYIKELDESIMAYIMTNYDETFSSLYISRLDNIKEVLDLVSVRESDIEGIFAPEIDKMLEDLFNSFMKKYFYRLTLDFYAYDLFSKDYDRMIKKIQDDKTFKALQKKITKTPDLHFKEFMKIYKYVKIFPELLTFVYLLNNEQYKKMPIQLHLISLFLTMNMI